jgi:adenylylsulfate kinase-like enzyme
VKKINKKKGILFWITGLSGAGKTMLGKKIKKDISKIYGPTLMISGDDIREIFNLKGYEYKERLIILRKYTKFAKFITNQKINIILAVVGMVEEPRKWNRSNIENYVEIYIKCKVRDIINLNKKKFYHKKKPGKIIGIDIKPEFPKKPDIIIKNNFNESGDKLANNLLKKINNLLHKKII